MRVRVRALSLVLVTLFLTVVLVRMAAGAAVGADYVLLIDCTGTMRYGGRGEATIASVRAFVDAALPGDCVSVFGYGEEPMPLLNDYPLDVSAAGSADEILEGVSFSFDADRTDITAGMELVWEQREQVFPGCYTAEGTNDAVAHLLVLTDGKLIPVYDDYSQYDAIYGRSRRRLFELARLFADDGVTVTTVCLGSADKVDNDLMSRVAELGGGEHVHLSGSDGLPETFRGIALAGRPETVAPRPAAAAPDAGADASTAVVVAEGAASSPEPTRTAPGATHADVGRVESSLVSRYAEEDLRDLIYQSIVGILGVAIGFVAIGIHRHESWARAFTKPLLKRQIRVRGYLKPVAACDVMTARAAIPIENPGLPAVQVGEGADLGGWLRGVLVEFIGSPDDTPPSIRVHKGEVTVEDQPVGEERKLQDGDRIQLGDECYCYLRGTRR